MEWRVSLFAHLRERHGDAIVVTSEANETNLRRALEAAGVEMAPCRIATATEFLTPGSAIPLDAELSVIPPVSGG
jgi:molybdopterin converting factor small subunit